MKKRVTDTLADRTRPPKGARQVIIRDTELTGFLLRAGKTGSAYCYEYKRGGKTTRITIGDAATWSAEDAREQARTLRREVDVRGEVVTAHKRLVDVWEALREHELPALAPRTQQDWVRRWERHIGPAMGSKQLGAIVKADCAKLHRSLKEKPFEANRVLDHLSRLFNYAIDDLEWFDGRNPARKVKKNIEPPREEYFDRAEIDAILEALPVTGQGDLIRFLLVTGCRPVEARQMTWGQVAGARWTKPAATTKQKKNHTVPLNQAAVELIERQPKRSTFVFTRANGQAVGKVFDLWQRTLQAAGVEHRRLYACRHTVASLLASQGVSLQIIGAVLGHSRATTTQRYAHLTDDAVRDAVERVVVPFKKAG